MANDEPGESQRPEGHTTREPWVRIGLITVVVLGAVFVLAAAPATAAPTFGDDDVTVDADESWIGIENDHTVTVEASDINTTDGPAEVTVDLSGWSAGDIKSGPKVTVLTSGVNVVGNVKTDKTEATFEVNDTSKTVIDLKAELEYTLNHPTDSSLDGNAYSVNVSITDADGTADGSAGVTLNRLSYEVDGEERFPPSTEFVFRNQAVTVTNLDPGGSYTLFEFDPADGTLGDPIESVDPAGTTNATIETEKSKLKTGWYIVYDGSEIATVEENAFQVETHQLSANQAAGEVDATGDGAETTVTIGSPIRTTAFDMNVSAQGLDADELYEVFEGDTNANVEKVDGSDSTVVVRDVTPGDALAMTFVSISPANYEFEFSARDTGAEASSPVTVIEREANAEFGSDVFETEAGEIVVVDISLEDTNEAYIMIGGDRGSGDNTLKNYFDILHVQGGTTIEINTRLLGTNVPTEDVYMTDGGSVTSYLQEPNDPVFDDVSFEGDADDIKAFRSELGIWDLPRPLQPDRYRLVAGLDGSVIVRDDGVPDFERPLARSNVLITPTDGFGNVTTYIAPEGSANKIDSPEDLSELTGELTERRTVAKGDRVVFEIEARGLTGLSSWLQTRMGADGEGIDPPMLSKLLSFPDGLRIDGKQMSPGMNKRTIKFDIDGAADGQLYLLPEPITEAGSSRYRERYYLVLDTRETGPFTREPEFGDEYRFRFGYNSTGETDFFGTVDHDALDPNGAPPHFPYYDADAGNQTETRFVTIEEPTVEYDRVDARGRPVIRSSETGTLSGVTNLAPGTDLTIQLIAENRTQPTRISIKDINIAPDGTFDVTHDLSVLEAGESVEVEFYAYQQLLDKRAGTVVSEDEELVRYEITDHTETATVTTGESLETITATIENKGTMTDRQSVELRLGEESIGERMVRLDANESTSIDFETATAAVEPGEYNYTISTNEDEAGGRITIEGGETETEPETEAEPETETEADENEEDEGETEPDVVDSENSESDPDEQPEDNPLGPLDELIGMVSLPVGTRHAIGGAAVVGTAHVLGYWA